MFPVITPLIAFALPMFVIWRAKTNKSLGNPYIYSIISFISCCATAIGQIFVFARRINGGDFAGVEDTIRAVLIICIGVIVVTAILNFVALRISYKK